MTRLNDNEVLEVARMQTRINYLENYIDRLYFAMKNGEFPTFRVDVADEHHFTEVYRFIEYIKKEHPQDYDQFNAKVQRERQSQIRRQQEQKAKMRKHSWKRGFSVFLHLLLGR